MFQNSEKFPNYKYNNLFSYIFSSKGCFERCDFIGITACCFLLLQFAMKQSLIFNNIIYCLTFYVLSIAIQKRCRDINWKGTFFIFLFFVTFPLLNYYQYMKINDIIIPKNLKDILAFLGSIYFLSHCFLILIPGKNIKDKDKNKQSMLLNYPYIYIVFGVIFFLVGQYFAIR